MAVNEKEVGRSNRIPTMRRGKEYKVYPGQWSPNYDDVSRKLAGSQRYRLLADFSENSSVFGAFRNLLTMLSSRVKWTVVPYDYDEKMEGAKEQAAINDVMAPPEPPPEPGAPASPPKAEVQPPPSSGPEEPQEPEDPRIQFLTEVFKDTGRSVPDIMAESVINAVINGWSFMEESYKYRRGDTGPFKSLYDDGMVGLRKVEDRPPHLLQSWIYDKYNTLIGLEQFGLGDGASVIPIEKGLYIQAEPDSDPESRSMLRSSYMAWCRQSAIARIQEIGIKRDLAGTPVAQPKSISPQLPAPDLWNEEDEDAKKTLESLIEMVTSLSRNEDEGLVLPETIDLSLLTSGGARQFDISDVLDRYDYLIAGSWLMDALLLGRNAGGSFALARVKMKLALAILDGLFNRAENALQLGTITRLLRMNGMDTVDPPRMMHERLDKLSDELVAPDTGPSKSGPPAAGAGKKTVRPRLTGEDN